MMKSSNVLVLVAVNWFLLDKLDGAPVLPRCLRENTTGIVPTIGVKMNGEVRIINEQKLFKLVCFSCLKPHAEGVDMYVNNVMEDSIRYHDGLCYHKLNECRQGRCTCSAKGKHFTWTFESDLSYIQFTCAMRFKDGNESRIANHQADLLYNGSVFTLTKKKNMPVSNQDKNNHNITGKSSEDEANYAGIVGYTVLGTVGGIFFGILTICLRRIHAFRKKDDRRQKQGNKKDNDEEDQNELNSFIGNKKDNDEEDQNELNSFIDDKMDKDRKSQKELNHFMDNENDQHDHGKESRGNGNEKEKESSNEINPFIGNENDNEERSPTELNPRIRKVKDMRSSNEFNPFIGKENDNDKGSPNELNPFKGQEYDTDKGSSNKLNPFISFHVQQ